MITSFTGPYAFMSNFEPCSFRMYNITFPSSEYAYQWHKLIHQGDREALLKCPTPGRAMRFAQHCEIVTGWDELRTGVMLGVLLEKFWQHPELREKLNATKGQRLIEGNKWHDRFWGMELEDGHWVGENHLGRILMIIRDWM